jgi:hypothetical protein
MRLIYLLTLNLMISMFWPRNKSRWVKWVVLPFVYSTKTDFCIVFFHDRMIWCMSGFWNNCIT